MVSLRAVSFYAGLLLLATSSVAVATNALPEIPSFSYPSVAQAPNRLSTRLLHRRVQRDLAKRLNVPYRSLQIIETTSETWPDQCLGLARPFQRCQSGEVSGWRTTLAAPQQLWVYRSDRTAQRLAIEPLPGTPDFGNGDFSVEASRRLLQTVSEQVNIPRDRLQIREVQPATWNGCLGVYVPDRACTMIALSGFRVLLSDESTTWVYHLSEDGEQIAQNATASGASASLQISFMPVENVPEADVPEANTSEAVDEQVVFQSQLSGDLAGSVQRVVLMTDGRLYREQSEPLTGSELTRTLIKTLTVAEMENFRSQLDQHRFPNLHGLRYLTEEAFADYPTIRLQTPYQRVEYIDLAIEQLPIELREIIQLWNLLETH